MIVKPGQTINALFSTHSSTGAAANADSTPTATAYKNGSVDAAFTLTVTTTGTAGVYKVTGTVPAGYVAGDMFDVLVSATVGGITDRQSLGALMVDTKRTSDLNDAAAAPTAAAVRAELDSNSTKLALLDVAVSSRMASFTYTAPPTAAAIRSEMDTNSTKLARLDVAVSTRMASFTYTAPPTVAEIRADLDANSTKLARLDAAVSTRMASFTYTAPPTVAQIRADLDANSTKLAQLDAAVSSRLSAAAYDSTAGDVSGIFTTLEEISAKTSTIGNGEITFVSPVSMDGQTVQLVAGDDYKAEDGRALEFTSNSWPVLTAGAVSFKVAGQTIAGTVTGPHSVRVEITREQTETMLAGDLPHELEAKLANGHEITLARGTTQVLAQL